jgi:hypothetical protein
MDRNLYRPRQLYGTQFHQADGKMKLSPIEDEDNVDRRRKEVGLPTLVEYRKMLEGTYKAKAPGKPTD